MSAEPVVPPTASQIAADAMRKAGTALVNHIGNMNSNAGRPDRPDAEELPTAVDWLSELDRRADTLTAALMAYSFAESARPALPAPEPPKVNRVIEWLYAASEDELFTVISILPQAVVTRLLAAFYPVPAEHAPPKLSDKELDRIAYTIGGTHFNRLLFDNVPSDMTWGELVQCVSDLLGSRPALAGSPSPEAIEAAAKYHFRDAEEDWEKADEGLRSSARKYAAAMLAVAYAVDMGAHST